MEIALRVRSGSSERVCKQESARDIILGRPGAELPVRRRRTPTVFFGADASHHDPGTVQAVLLDLTPDRKVSRLHARLYYELSTWWIEPLSKTNRVYLNSAALNAVAELEPGDVVRTGDTLIAIDFPSASTEPGPGTIEASISADETLINLDVSEDRRLEILNRVSSVVARSSSRQGVVEGMIRELGDAYPQSSRRTLMLIEEREIVPRAFWPPDRSRVSFTLSRRAIQRQQSLRWTRRLDGSTLATSLIDVTDALYSPMIVGGKVLGVLHIDSVAAQPIFSTPDLQLLTVLATTIGAALRETGVAATDLLERLPSVFVSYAHSQRTFVDRIVADLRRRRIKVWVDERLRSGDPWREELANVIAGSDALVFVVSRDSIASPWTKWEMEQALAKSKPVFPVLFESCDLPDWLSGIQYADAIKHYENAVTELAERAQQVLK
jgi:hypothetical protein